MLPIGVARTQHTLGGEGCYGVFWRYAIISFLAGKPHESRDS